MRVGGKAPAMRSPRRAPPSDDEDEFDDEEEEEEAPARPSRRSAPRSGRHRRSEPPRRWRSPDEEDEEEDEEGSAGGPPPSWQGSGPRRKPPVFWRARDSLYFEPLVALAIIVVLLVGLYAYTANWPPVYVVESPSMQHGSSDHLGLINTGDMVMAQKVPTSEITPYLVGMVTGYSTYGEYGDVVLYHPNGDTSATPVIHRAILYLVWTGTNSSGPSYSAPELAQLPTGSCGGPNPVYATPGTSNGCATTGITGTLELFHIGWRAINLSIDLASPALGGHSGFLTLGDNNSAFDQSGAPNPQISSLVEPGWVIGVARGMIPWFGAIKLLLQGSAQQVPSQSWQFLGLTVAGLVLLAFGIHYALRAEGIETPLRKEEEEAAEEEAVERQRDRDPEPTPSHRWKRSIRPWSDEEADDEDLEEEPRPRPSPVAAGHRHRAEAARRGRPRPRVRRNEHPRRRRRDEDL